MSKCSLHHKTCQRWKLKDIKDVEIIQQVFICISEQNDNFKFLYRISRLCIHFQKTVNVYTHFVNFKIGDYRKTIIDAFEEQLNQFYYSFQYIK